MNRKYSWATMFFILLLFPSCLPSYSKKGTEAPLIKKSDCFGALAGLVTNEYEQPIPGVYIVIKGTSYKINADTLGNFFIGKVPPGKYNVWAKTIGYKEVTIPEVVIYADSITTLNFSMEVQPVILHNIIIDPNRK
jgi:hypothetical protein